jgi:uncharacterized protein (DUF433 family)
MYNRTTTYKPEHPTMEIAPHINVDPAICGGTPVITGTRIPVSIVVGALASDMTEAEVMDEYVLSKVQIKAALAYAADMVKHVEVFPIGA